MGIVKCERHGLQGWARVSPALRSAMKANAKVSPSDVGRVLYTTISDDEYPPGRAWFEPSLVRHIGDRVIGWEELEELKPTGACHACLDEWLRANGVETGYSTEEQRFESLAERLSELLRPRLEPTLVRISKSVLSRGQASGWGFSRLRGLPFVAHAGNNTLGAVQVEVRDHGDALVGAVRSTLFSSAVPSGIASTKPITLVNAELDASGVDALLVWAAEVERFLSGGLASLSL
jgi:hypothetical protein